MTSLLLAATVTGYHAPLAPFHARRHGRAIACADADAPKPEFLTLASLGLNADEQAALEVLLQKHDVRERDPAYHLHLQKVDVVLILSATLLLLSSTSLASLTTMPPGEAPAGSFAIMVSLVGFLRGARAIAAFVMFGSQPLMDC